MILCFSSEGSRGKFFTTFRETQNMVAPGNGRDGRHFRPSADFLLLFSCSLAYESGFFVSLYNKVNFSEIDDKMNEKMKGKIDDMSDTEVRSNQLR